MSNYGGGGIGPRYTRPLLNDRSGPRFNTARNYRPPSQQHHQPRPNKPPTDISISTPPSSNAATIAKPTSVDLLATSPSKSTISENPSTEATTYPPIESSNSSVDNQSKTDIKSSDEQSNRPRTDSTPILSQPQMNERKIPQGGRCRLFIGNVPSDLTQDEFQSLFGKYGELVEYFVNPSRGFGFIKLSSRQLAEQAKYDLDGYLLRGKPLRIRFASQGATIKVKNLSPNVSNELLKDAFEQYFGGVERAVVIVDDKGKSTGEGIIEFEKKPSAQKCLNECTERCFFLTNELRPVIVEPWDIKDEEDGLPEKSLVRNPVYIKERELKPRFAEINTIENTIGLKWKELELQEKQLLEEVKRRMQYATEQVQIEIDQMYLEHQSQVLREELVRRQEDLRRIDELRSQEMDRRWNIIPMHHPYPNTIFHQNQIAANALQYDDFQHSPSIDAAYTTNQVAHSYGLGNVRPSGDDFNQQQGYDRKRPRY